MKMLLWLPGMLFLLYGFQHRDRFDLRDDLKKDRKEATQHGTSFSGSAKTWDAFSYYALMDVSRFKFTSKKSGPHVVLRWAKSQLIIYEIKTELPADTGYVEFVTEIDSVAKKTDNKRSQNILLTPYTVVYHTYVIKPVGKSAFIYVRDNHDGLNECSIGTTGYHVTREDILLGKPALKLNEVLALTE